MALDIKQLLAVQGRKALNVLRMGGGKSPVLAGLQFQVTANCNLLCNMCDTGQANINRIPLPKTGIDIYLVEKALHEVVTWLPKPRVHFIGGEPLMYKDLGRAAALCRENGFWWGFTTNGWFLERDAEMLVDNHCAAINVSVDGPCEIHNEIRGAAKSFEKLVAGIAKLTRVKKERGVDTPAIAVNCVINAANQHALEQVVHDFAEAGVQTVNFQHLMWRDDYNPELAAQIDPAIVLKFQDRATSGDLPLPVRFYPNLKTDKVEPYYRELHSPELGSACVLPWIVMRIDPDGLATICMEKLGSVREHSLAELWNNERAQDLRRKVLDDPIFHPWCQRCCHRQY